MAKGNDGNLLQHSIECELALALAEKSNGCLYLVATHGMAAFEPFADRSQDSSPSAYRKLELALLKAATISVGHPEIPNVLRAYNACRASPYYYPNSVEIIKAVVAQVKGRIVEVAEQKAISLKSWYEGSQIQVLNQSWRFSDSEAQSLPSCIETPWLITLDPMTYVEGPEKDDDKLRLSDIRLIRNRLEKNQSRTKQCGAVVISCYSLMPTAQSAFKSALESQNFPNLRYAETVARGGNRHVAAVSSTEADVSERTVSAWNKTLEWLETNSK